MLAQPWHRIHRSPALLPEVQAPHARLIFWVSGGNVFTATVMGRADHARHRVRRLQESKTRSIHLRWKVTAAGLTTAGPHRLAVALVATPRDRTTIRTSISLPMRTWRTDRTTAVEPDLLAIPMLAPRLPRLDPQPCPCCRRDLRLAWLSVGPPRHRQRRRCRRRSRHSSNTRRAYPELHGVHRSPLLIEPRLTWLCPPNPNKSDHDDRDLTAEDCTRRAGAMYRARRMREASACSSSLRPSMILPPLALPWLSGRVGKSAHLV